MKKTAREVIKNIQSKNANDVRAVYSFRLPVVLMKRLEAKCKKNEISMTAVVQELLQEFVVHE